LGEDGWQAVAIASSAMCWRSIKKVCPGITSRTLTFLRPKSE
jgi:hypothetical protein